MVDLLQLDDLVYTYPEADAPGIQAIINEKEEFNQLKTTLKEDVPKRGDLFKHQKLIVRIMQFIDNILIYHRTGTGKTCTAVGVAESFMAGVAGASLDFVTQYLKPQKTYIQKIYFITRSKALMDEFRHQLVCLCTSGKYLGTKSRPNQPETARGRGIRIKKEVSKYYNITTHKVFALNELKSLSDEEIRERYSGSLFIIDEVHSLRIRESEGEEEGVGGGRQQEEIYNLYWKLFHNIVRSKIMLMTATPMIDSVNEIKPIMDLILPVDLQMPSDYNYQAAKAEDLYKYFEGRVSFIREASTGAFPLYQGVPLKGSFSLDDRKYNYQTLIYPTQMSDKQSKVYNESLKSSSRVYLDPRQSADFVFPDDTYGKRGFDSNIIKKDNDNFSFSDELITYYNNNLDNIAISSSKYAKIISLCLEAQGSCYCFSNFVYGSGAVVFGLCLEAMGFEKFNHTGPIFKVQVTQEGGEGIQSYCQSSSAVNQEVEREVFIEKKLRYALITKSTSEKLYRNIFDVFNSYENRHGEYIKVFVATKMLSTGINLANVIQIHINDPSWNQSNNYQATSRAIRATSHNVLLKELRQKAIENGQSPNNISLNIDIYRHVAIPKGHTYQSIDEEAYKRSEIKDVEIKTMERIMKEASIDCYLNYHRNVRPDDVDGSEACDYDVCHYQCLNGDNPPEYLDYTSYDILYADEVIPKIIQEIKNLFNQHFYLSLENIVSLLSQYRQRHIIMSLEKIISGRIPITNRFGMKNYLMSSQSAIFLISSFPAQSFIDRINLFGSSYYTQNITTNHLQSLNDYTAILQAQEEEAIIQELRTMNPESEGFITKLQKLSMGNQAKLLEESLSQYIINAEDNFIDAILHYYERFIYYFNEPVRSIELEKSKLSTKGKGRGRKPSGIIKISRINPSAPSSILPEEGTEMIYLHTLYTHEFELTSYNITSKANKAEGRIRLLKPSENIGWRDILPYEYVPYNELIQRKMAELRESYESHGIYGTISTVDGKFRIVDLTNVNPQEGKRSTKTQPKGQVCISRDKADLINILYKLGIESDVEVDFEDCDQEGIISSIIQQGATGKALEKYLKDADLEKAQFFYKWLQSPGTKDDLCNIIRDYFRENNLIFEI